MHEQIIFALGVVIYEMATGRKAFEGDSKASLIAKILTFQPPAIENDSTGEPARTGSCGAEMSGQEAGRALAECSGADLASFRRLQKPIWRCSRLKREEKEPSGRSERN